MSRNNHPGSPTLTWSSLQHLLENAIPHVLIILDCCFAANAARDTAEGTTKEILAACGRENLTTGVGFRSFTSALIEELHAFRQQPFTVAMLHSRLVTIRWRLQFTPFYALLSEHGGNSIHLAPLPAPAPQIPIADVPTDNTCIQGDDPIDLSSSENSTFTSSPQQSSQSSVSPAPETRVLLAVSIDREAHHDVSEWATWLTSEAPWDVTKIEVQVEGVYKSHSMLLLVSIPTFAWDGLLARTAYRFIAFIKSDNLQRPRTSLRLSSEGTTVKRALICQGHPQSVLSPHHEVKQKINPSDDASEGASRSLRMKNESKPNDGLISDSQDAKRKKRRLYTRIHR